MTGPVFFTEEVSNSKVAAIYPSNATARQQAERVKAALGLSDRQVQVLTPGDRRVGRKLEPETHGIFRTMIWAHAKLGAIGLVVGLVLYFVLRAADVAFVTQSPMLSLLMLVVYGGVAGLMLGGLVTLRPDHDPYVMKVTVPRRADDPQQRGTLHDRVVPPSHVLGELGPRVRGVPQPVCPQ